MNIQELRIAGINGVEIPDGLNEGDRFMITATLMFSSSWRETIDVATYDNPEATLESGLYVGTVLIGEAETRT